MHSYTPCAIPSLYVLLAQLPHRLHLFLIRLTRLPNAHLVSFVRKFAFCVLPCLPWCHFPIFLYHPIFKLLAWGFRVPTETQSFVEACFWVFRSHMNFPRMLVPWQIALLRQSSHLLIVFVISRLGREFFFYKQRRVRSVIGNVVQARSLSFWFWRL